MSGNDRNRSSSSSENTRVATRKAPPEPNTTNGRPDASALHPQNQTATPVAAVEHITTAGDIRCFLGEYYGDPQQPRRLTVGTLLVIATISALALGVLRQATMLVVVFSLGGVGTTPGTHQPACPSDSERQDRVP